MRQCKAGKKSQGPHFHAAPGSFENRKRKRYEKIGIGIGKGLGLGLFAQYHVQGDQLAAPVHLYLNGIARGVIL